MARDPRKLRVFSMADGLVPHIYSVTKSFPAQERYGLVAQMRRAAVSIATNIVEGSARRTEKEYLNFLNIANGSAYELAFLLRLSERLGFISNPVSIPLVQQSERIAAGLTALIDALESQTAAQEPHTRTWRGRKPEA